MKIKFALGPYGYEVVLGNITEEIYNKFSQDNDALRDAVTGFEENSDIKEWSDMDDIAHNYGAVLEEEGTDQYLKIFNENNDELLNIPLTLDEIQKNGFNIKEKPFNLIEAKNAKEAFLTSSTLSVLPVVKIDNYNISKGKPGDITKKIINLYNNYISKNKTLLSRELKIA